MTQLSFAGPVLFSRNAFNSHQEMARYKNSTQDLFRMVYQLYSSVGTVLSKFIDERNKLLKHAAE